MWYRFFKVAGGQIAFDFSAPRRVDAPPLRVGILGSGSSGNAVVVESGSHRILLDAGFSSRELVRRMGSLGFDPKTLSAVFVTHEHQDHVRGADAFAHRFKLPLYATAGTLDNVRLRDKVRCRTIVLRSGEPVAAGGFVVEPFLLPHDAQEPVGFVVEDPFGRRVGLVADLGCRSRLAWGRLCDLDVLLLETNHDPAMLAASAYPAWLKRRIGGQHGDRKSVV